MAEAAGGRWPVAGGRLRWGWVAGQQEPALHRVVQHLLVKRLPTVTSTEAAGSRVAAKASGRPGALVRGRTELLGDRRGGQVQRGPEQLGELRTDRAVLGAAGSNNGAGHLHPDRRANTAGSSGPARRPCSRRSVSRRGARWFTCGRVRAGSSSVASCHARIL